MVPGRSRVLAEVARCYRDGEWVMTRLFEPDDSVSLRLVRAYRILPGDILWGLPHDGGFALFREGLPVPQGAQPSTRTNRVWLEGSEYPTDALVLVEVRA